MKNAYPLILIFSISTVLFSYRIEETQEPPSTPYDEAIAESSRILDSLYQNWKVPGIDIAVAVDGEIIWSEGYGYADLEHEVPVKTGVTLFRIGSVSKPITSAAMGILMDRNELDLTDPVQKYVPYFPEKQYPLTVKQVAGHIGGIRHYRNLEFLSSKKYTSVKEGMEIFIDDSLLFEPGTDYSYSSYGFNLLSAVVEGASGEDFLTFMQKEVFDPLKMTSTTADKNDSIIINRTSFYDVDSLVNIINAPYVDNSYKWAGGGFISTTTDLIRFGSAHLQPGFFLSEETLKELTSTQVLQNGEKTNYGVGWSIGQNYLGHGGGSVGGITAFNMNPKEKVIVVILSNSSITGYGNVPERIMQLFVQSKEDNSR